MAGGITDNGRNYMLSTTFGAIAPDVTYYVGLMKIEPDVSDTGLTVTEPVGGSYARVAVTNNTTNFPVPTVGVMTIATDVTFPQSTADWGIMRYAGIFDALTGGSLICWFDLATAYEVGTNSTPVITANTLAMNLRTGE